MLYVFHVDTGTMLTFDMNLAMESVEKLQEVIAKTYRIPEDKQVLLISGGENLHPTSRVCSYSSGTDTNPIFLFSKHSIEAATPPSASVNYGSDADLKEQVEGSLHMHPTYETVVTRAQLALQFQDVAKEEMRVCERLVHDQHLQHQGWAAVIANLEDITSAFKSRAEVFRVHMEEYVTSRQKYIDILSDFPATLHLLGKIPMLPCLITVRRVPETSVDPNQMTSSKTLLEWIVSQDSRNTLEQMAQQCQLGLQQFDDAIKDSLMKEVTNLLEAINNQSMKEVKGLEDRLYGLEQLMFGARRLVQEQGEMAQGFVANQNRARNLQDTTVLPDLCNSHKRQLLVMLKNQQNLRDIRRRCTAAKEELSVNLHTRLRWVMFVEKSVCDVDSKLVIHHDNLKKLRRKLEIIHQMYRAPEVYARAIVEVVRRKRFAQTFLQWAGELAEESYILHREEKEKREEFLSHLKHHFLHTLFPGLEDLPPEFATQAPDCFDEGLPKVNMDDVEFLQKEVPELAEKLRIPEDLEVVRKFTAVCLKGLPQLQDFPGIGTTKEILPATLELTEQSDIVVLKHSQIDVSESITQADASFIQTTSTLDIQKVELKVPEDANIPVDSSTTIDDKKDIGPPTITGQTQEKYDESADDVEGAFAKTKKKNRTTPGASPDFDDAPSETFTTADFFIDESMPSSLTESTLSRKLAELHLVVQEKNFMIESRERELDESRRVIEELKPKLSKAEENFKVLHDLAEKSALVLRCDVLSLERQVQKEKDDFQVFMDSVTKSVVEVVEKFEEEQQTMRESSIEFLKAEQTQVRERMEHNLEVAVEKTEVAQNETKIYEMKLSEKTTELDSYMEEMAIQLKDIKEEHETELKTCSNQLTLEHEVEMEKVRSDLEEDISKLESELKDLKVEVENKETELATVVREKEETVEAFGLRFQKEKDDILKIMEADYKQKKDSLEKEIRESLVKEIQLEKEKVTQEHETEIKLIMKNIKEDCDKKEKAELERLKNELTEKHECDIKDLQGKLQKENENELAKKETELKAAHEKELCDIRETLDNVHEELAEAKTAQAFSDSEHIRLEDHARLLEEIKKVCEEDKKKAVSVALAEVDESHEVLLRKLEKEKQDSLQAMKSSFMAEKQVNFNEALEKVVTEKDKVIEDLRKREMALQEQQEKDKEIIEKLRQQWADKHPSEGATALPTQTERAPRDLQRELEEELGRARQDNLKLQSQLQSSMMQRMTQSAIVPGMPGMMGQSVVPVCDATSQDALHHLETNRFQNTSSMFSSMWGVSVLPVVELDTTRSHPVGALITSLKQKENDVARLEQKIMELSMSSSSRAMIQDKVSITSCNTGDIVLLCLDERHDHYVVFTLGTTLHFLHNDCLDTLGLRNIAREPRKSWVLAEITEKEYCQARKTQNRFKVPVGTKFYRVKAKPWNRQAALQREMQAGEQSKSVGGDRLQDLSQPLLPPPQQGQPSELPQTPVQDDGRVTTATHGESQQGKEQAPSGVAPPKDQETQQQEQPIDQEQLREQPAQDHQDAR